MGSGPPDVLVRTLVEGPGALSGFEWHPEVASTNALAAEAARRGVPEIHAVAADVQTAGRGRWGRSWHAPAGTSLMVSLVLRPRVAVSRLGTLPLLIGSVLAEVLAAHLWDGVRGPDVALKWPNDVLVEDRKVAGVLVERLHGAVVAGLGCNVDWRGVERPAELAGAGSLAEVVGGPVDRWRLFAGLVGVLGRRYDRWQADPAALLEEYRARCATLGREVRVERADAPALQGQATDIGADGRLLLSTPHGDVAVTAGDVVHLR